MTEAESKEYIESVYNGIKILRDALPTVEQAANSFHEALKNLDKYCKNKQDK